MSLRAWRFLMLMLAALGMGPGIAHVLELAPKMQYDAQLYTAVTSTLYRLYGPFGALVQVGAVLVATVVALRLRGRPSFGYTLSGLLCLVLSLGLWFALVQPVNVQWGEVLRTAPDMAPEAYLRLRGRWEYGHAAAFAAWLAGAGLLVGSVLAEIPPDRPPARRAA